MYKTNTKNGERAKELTNFLNGVVLPTTHTLRNVESSGK